MCNQAEVSEQLGGLVAAASRSSYSGVNFLGQSEHMGYLVKSAEVFHYSRVVARALTRGDRNSSFFTIIIAPLETIPHTPLPRHSGTSPAAFTVAHVYISQIINLVNFTDSEMSVPRVGPLTQLWSKWKTLRLPWRKQYLAGKSLSKHIMARNVLQPSPIT